MFVTDTVMAIKICWNGSQSGPIMLNGNWKNETMNVDRVLPSILVETCLCVFQKVYKILLVMIIEATKCE